MNGCPVACVWLLLAATQLPVVAAATNKLKFAEIIPLLESGYASPKALASRAAGGPQAAPERHRFQLTPEGYLESLGAAPGTDFPAPPGPAGQPETTARNFLRQHGKLFGITSPAVDFKLRKKNSGNGRHSIRLTQTYDGIPVFGGEIVVQVNQGGGVEHTSGNFDRDTSDLDAKELSTRARLTADEAKLAAQSRYAPQAPGQGISVSPPELAIFVPGLLKLAGPKRLTWKLEVWSADRQTIGKQVFIDAHSGGLVQEIALIHEVLHRVIHDSVNTTDYPGSVIRQEGDAPSGVLDGDLAYEGLGETYDFFRGRFERDGIDNNGARLLATVRYCKTNECPMRNAFWNGVRMVFGPGFAVDDVCGHELTHGVTSDESGLIYLNESGAINESLSDVFGEFIDQTNGRGNDGASSKWLIGEDLPGGAFRSMKYPHDYPTALGATGHPDWLGDSRYRPPEAPPGTPAGDHGGVHANSGVNNKLCYLLTDGDTFRDITVAGMGIDRVAALYYEANVNLLVSSSGWDHLGISLRQAAVNLGWNVSQRANLDQGLLAVGVGSPLPQYFVDENASGACFHTGDSYCDFLGDNGPYNNLGVAITARAGDKTLLLRGTAHQTRISGQAKVVPWDGNARIQP